MKPDDLDKILLSEKQIVPSRSFAEDAMARVRAESFRRPPSFQSICFAAFMFVLALATVWIFPSRPVLREMHILSYSIGKWMVSVSEAALPHSFLLSLYALIGTLLIVWLSLRLAPGEPGR